ncbi:hypothetical protein K523DRAFT_253309 [Schizophyllum commune Tattone D]|nr:hypothetical protein K523DRAFT_253309 [Schizophyllum commune Tattone D]
MNMVTVPPPRSNLKPCTYRHADLERRIRDEIGRTSYINVGLLLHSLWDGGYMRDSTCTTTEFFERVQRDVKYLASTTREGQWEAPAGAFFVHWKFGRAYRTLWQEHKTKNALTGPATDVWAREEASGQSGIQDEGLTAVFFHVCADLAKMLTLQAKTYLDIFIPGNIMRRLVAKAVDPNVIAIYARLPNGALLHISWYEALPVPQPPFKREIHLELHAKVWHPPTITLTHRALGKTAICFFYNKLSDEPLGFYFPILEGGWIELGPSRRFLKAHGVRWNKNTIIMRSSTVNPASMLEATWNDPIPVPEENVYCVVFRLYCSKCLLMEPFRALHTNRHFCTERR